MNENGASIRAGDFADPTAIPAQISLPAAVWERLTADLRDDDRVSLGRPELPNTPLHARIELFLDMQLFGWEGSVRDDMPSMSDLVGLTSDLDDGVSF